MQFDSAGNPIFKNGIENALLQIAKPYNDNIMKNSMKAGNIVLQAKKDSEEFLLSDDPKNKELKNYLISTIERG